MRTVSILLTVLLVLPIGYNLFNAYEVHLMQSRFMHSQGIDFATWRTLSFILIDVVFIIIALVLNFKEKYLENSVMCGTLLLAFIMSVILNFATSFLFNWLK
jgi:hypothetical protein